MSSSGEFDFFQEWMKKEPNEWLRRADVDLTVPPHFKNVTGCELMPVYVRFLEKFGALKLMKWWCDTDQFDGMYEYTLFTPKEIVHEYLNSITLFNAPEYDADFSCFIPFCQLAATSAYYCFDTRYYGTDDLPVIDFDQAMAIPEHELKTAVSFKYWLEKIVRFGSANIDYLPDFPSEPMDLLKAVYDGKLSADDAGNLYHEGERRRFNGRLPCHETEFFRLSKRELNATRYAANFDAIAKWRYEGWPSECCKCKKPIDLDADDWGVTWKTEEGIRTRHYLIHDKCMKINAPPEEDKEKEEEEEEEDAPEYDFEPEDD